MEDKLQLRLGELLQKEAGRTIEEWSPPHRESLDRVPVGLAEEERILQLIMGPCKDPRPAAFAAVTPTSPLLLHELMQMRNSGGCKVTGFRQAAPAVNAYTMNGKGASSLLAIQSNDDASCCSSTRTLELESQNGSPLPYGWEKCLDLQTGSIYYLNRNTGLTTSVDPRMAPPSSSTASGCHVLTTIWPPPPTSPSSASSDVTYEGVPTRPCTVDGVGRQGQIASSAVKAQGEALGLTPRTSSPDGYEWSDLDLTLSLRPCSGLMKRQPPEACKATSINIAATASSSQALVYRGSPNINNLSSIDLSPSSACHSTVFSEANGFCRMQLSDASRSTVMPSAPAFAKAVKSQMHRADAEASCMALFKSVQLDEQRKQRRQNEVSATTSFSVISNRGDDDSEEVGAPTSCMITGGCPRCLMFVMVPGTSMPKCPRCGTHIDINTPGLTAAACTRSVSSERDMVSPPPKKAKLLLPAAICMESPHSSRKPAASLV